MPTTGTATPAPAGAALWSVERRSRRTHRSGAVARPVEVLDEQTLPVDHARLEQLARHVLASLDVPRQLELSVTCVNVERITQLNAEHLSGTGPTDVLAFPIDAPDHAVDGVPGLLGDVVLCPEVAARQAPAHQRTPATEMDLLLVHGILHLLGHDHAEADERARMFALTDALLVSFADQRLGAGRDDVQ